MTETGAGARATAPPTAAGDTGYAIRHGLIRPRAERQIAGVCAGVARATRTDPLLWRILVAVGVLFGGVGLVAYLLGWLLMPEEGDTSSPLEALFGRGRSSTSTGVTVLLALVTGLLLTLTVQWTPLALLVLAGGGYLLYRQLNPPPAPPPPTAAPPPHPTPPFPPPTPPTSPPYPAPPAYPATPAPQEPPPYRTPTEPLPDDAATDAVPGDASTEPGPDDGSSEPEPGGAVTDDGTGEPSPEAGPGDTSTEGGSPDESSELPETGVPAPGVSAAAGPVRETVAVPVPPDALEATDNGEGPVDEGALLAAAERYRAGPVSGPEPMSWPVAPPEAPAPERSSRLGRVALFAVLIALGLVAALDLSGGRLGIGAYAAAALAVIGAALVVGAWVGRARWLIWLGAALSLVLAVSAALSTVNIDGDQTWRPATVDQLRPSYEIDFGNGTLDLRQVDFAGADVTVEVKVNAGNMEVLLPPEVDVKGAANVQYGNAEIFGDEINAGSGIDREIDNLGDDQATGPGTLTLRAYVNAGNLEVHR